MMRLGDLDGGAIAEATRGAVVEFADSDGGSTTRVSWWIGAEDRWHRPEFEAATRDRVVDACPVLESTVRVPGGDAVGTVAGARIEGGDGPGVVLQVANDSAVPVAVALVVESTRPIEAGPAGVAVDGVGSLALARAAMGFAAGADVDAVLRVLEAGDAATTGLDARGGAVAVVFPLPHTARAVAAFVPGVTAPRLLDRDRLPSPAQVAAGWAAHRAADARVEFGDAALAAAVGLAACDLLLGAPVGADVATRARLTEASARLGRDVDAAAIADLLRSQKGSGAIAADDPAAATVAVLRAAGAWWDAGGDPAAADTLLPSLVGAARWLTKRRHVAEPTAVAEALRRVAGLAGDIGEEDAADDLWSVADGLGPRQVPWSPDPDGPGAELVVSALDGAARPERDGVAVALSSDLASAGAAAEAHGLPTRWGRLSYAVRWHGPRPALLWEVEPWAGRARPNRTFRLTAPALDPEWVGEGDRGDALLRGAPPAPKGQAGG